VPQPAERSYATAQVPSRYRVHHLPRGKPTERGVLYLRGEEQFLLAWERVKRAFAGRVGGAGEAWTAVFDLAVEVWGAECVVCRLEVPPARAPQVARAIELGVAPEARTPGLCALAGDGQDAGRPVYADLETFGDAALESIRYGISRGPR
jgi:hypothetical protein